MFSDQLGQWDDDSNSPHKKTNVTKDDAEPSSMMIQSNPLSNRWFVTRYLGRCSHSFVYSAESTIKGDEDNLPFEMTIKSTELSQSTRVMNEEYYLTRLRNPFVISCYGHEMTLEKNSSCTTVYYNTILEHCSGGSLAKHMKIRWKLPEDDVKRFSSDILVGLKYIHGEEIVHCDIKPKNILLQLGNSRFCSSDGFMAKISGFEKAMTKGSAEYGEEWCHSRRRGKTRYMSPELMRDMVFDYGSDVWAFGCMVLEMLTGEQVWGEYGVRLSWEDWFNLIGKSCLVPNIPDYLSEKAKDFLTKCLERDPVKRWFVDSLLNHQFLKWDDDEDEEEEQEQEETNEEEEEEEEEEQEETNEEEEEEEEDEDFYNELEYEDVEAYGEEEEDEEIYDELENAFAAYLEAALVGEEEEQQQEVIDLDDEYPKEDSEEDL